MVQGAPFKYYGCESSTIFKWTPNVHWSKRIQLSDYDILLLGLSLQLSFEFLFF